MTSKLLPKTKHWTDLELPLTYQQEATLDTCAAVDPHDGGWTPTPMSRLIYLEGPTMNRRFIGWLLDYEKHDWSTLDQIQQLHDTGTMDRLSALVERYLALKGSAR